MVETAVEILDEGNVQESTIDEHVFNALSFMRCSPDSIFNPDGHCKK